MPRASLYLPSQARRSASEGAGAAAAAVVRPRAALLLWIAVGAAIVALPGYVYWNRTWGSDAPRGRAEADLARAQELLARAGALPRGAQVEEQIERAQTLLWEARALSQSEQWVEADSRALDGQRILSDLIAASAKAEPPTARFVKIQGTVEVKRRDDTRWIGAHPGTALDAGDLVQTRKDSSAQLVFFDGVNLVLAPASLIEIQLGGVTRDGLSRSPNVFLSAGIVDLSTPKYNVAGTSPILSTENVEATLGNDTDIRVTRLSTKGAATTDLSVSGTGGAAITNATGEQAAIRPREGAIVSGAGEDARIVKKRLPRTPLLVAPADMLPLEAGNDVELSWQAISEASSYKVEVADSSLWAHRIVEQDVEGAPVLRVKGLASGDYYWRVAAVLPNGAQSAFSPHRKFSLGVPRVSDPSDRMPPRLVVLKNMVFENIVIVSGETEPGALLTVNDERVDVDPEGAFVHFAILIHDGPNEIHVISQDAAGNATKRSIHVDVAVF